MMLPEETRLMADSKDFEQLNSSEGQVADEFELQT